MPFDDVRRYLWQRVNDYRAGLGLPSLEFSDEQSRACKQHANYLASTSRSKGQLTSEQSPENLRPGWNENVAATSAEQFEPALDELVWRNVTKLELAQRIRQASQYFGADVTFDKDEKRLFLVMRLK